MPRDDLSRDGWWQVFGSAELNGLVGQLFAGNPTMAEAEARVRQARALVRQERASVLIREVTGTASITQLGARRWGTMSGTLTDYALAPAPRGNRICGGGFDRPSRQAGRPLKRPAPIPRARA